MKFATVDGARSEAFRGGRGQCFVCCAPMVAKRGAFVAGHWAHKSRNHCDRWWEAETDWHRRWKDRFPAEWQEVAVYDEAVTDCHIADVRTSAGLVIEFQRSTITPDDVRARERFYQRMIWVIDGCRNEFDPVNFGLFRSRVDERGLATFDWYSRSKLFHRWLTSKPVFIDFRTDGFWRILRFDASSKRGLAGLVDIDEFVKLASAGTTDFNSGGGSAGS